MIKNDAVLSEAKRLHDLGFAIHWLHKKSKRPIESGWTTGPRKSWSELTKSYSQGLNVGVRLGTPSKIKNNFLAVVDVDVKSSEDRHAKEVEAGLKSLAGTLTLPEVKSGRGNGSRHYYVLTPKPIKPFKAMQSTDMVKVPMPSVQPSKRDLARLTAKEITAGLRMRPAWEISIMGDGQQVVLPPSVHPDSGKAYLWRRPFNKVYAREFDLAALRPKDLNLPKDTKFTDSAPRIALDFSPIDLPVECLPVSEKIKSMIISGDGVADRSAMLLPISAALLKAGLTRNEILSVLTDSETYIGQTGYHHAKTTNRARAAQWVYRYSLKKVEDANSCEAFFSEKPAPYKKLSDAEIEKEQSAFNEAHDYRLDLDVTKDDNIRATLKNIVLILQNEIGAHMIKRDVFASRDFWAENMPWGSEENAAICDDDTTRTKLWLAQNMKVEPNRNIVSEAFSVIACENTFDPVKDWLEELPAWDHVERLDTWLIRNFNAQGGREYLAQVFRKWICAMVMRVYQPGIKFDWMPIFEGAQGVGKSSFGRILCGDKYFLDSLPNLQDKDAALALRGIWAVEMGELASFRKNEIEVVKAFVTRTVDKVRPPYGERWIDSHRRCVFFGTTNFETYLRDDSGNRRFKPVKVGLLNFEALEAERVQLFAEALWLYKSGFENERTLELTGEAKVYEVEIQAEKMVSDEASLMVEKLQEFIAEETAKNFDDSFDFSRFKISDLFSRGMGGRQTLPLIAKPLENWKFDSRNVQFASKAVKALGGETVKIMGQRYWKIDIGAGSESDLAPKK